ncbi:IS5/IS1182 family transposase, partial [Pseudomonas aeruginosa]
MKQMTFADAEYAGKRKQTRKELFLIEMEQKKTSKNLI